MKRTMIHHLGAAMLLLGCQMAVPAGSPPDKPDAGWLQLKFDEGRFRIRMPAAPVVKTVSSETEYGPLVCVTYVCEARNGDVFVVSHVDFPEEAFRAGPEAILFKTRAGFLRACAGRVVNERRIVIDGHAGIESVIETADGIVMVWRGFIVHGRVYQMLARVEGAKDAESPRVRAFLESFASIAEHRAEA